MSGERVPVSIFEDSASASKALARRIAEIIRSKQAEGVPAVLGLPTGHTPIKVYHELARMHREEGLDFSNVVTFNLDEYWPISHEALQSYHSWMRENFFKHVNIQPANIHIPSGEIPEDRVAQHCQQYEHAIAEAGGLDMLILGIGRSGHVGFNEPGSGKESLTRQIHLDKITRKDAASDFFGEENVPEMAITMGVGTILAAREIALMAFGEHKAPIIRRTVEGSVSDTVAASFLQEHPNVHFYLDESAADSLTRLCQPWRIGSCEWDEIMTRRAVIWLSKKLKKPILKLTHEDYAENGLASLLAEHGGAYKINITVFKRMMNTITGWPGGKGADRRVLIFSPHPDDDVISMGGTLMRLAAQGHDVHVAYMTSGFLSVFDHDVQRHAEFVREFSEIFNLAPGHAGQIKQTIDDFLASKKPGDIDILEVQQVKALIRRSEAINAAEFSGLSDSNIHFLDMPFYNTGTVQKHSIGKDDIEVVTSVIEAVKPNMIFAAGDMSDPHGTHRLCLDALLLAMDKYAAGDDWPELWLYRGAWQEWSSHQIDMAVPLAPDELQTKRQAIYRHESQKDKAMFPGPYDSREFWQRSEDRNKSTANDYDGLGLPEYHAIEAFVRYPLPRSAHAEGQLTRN